MVDCDRLRWSELTEQEKLSLIPAILERLDLEIWYYKYDGKDRELEVRKKEFRTHW